MTDTTRGTSAPTNSDQHGASGGERVTAAVHDAGERARDLNQTGREEAGRVADEVKTQTSHLVGETRHRARDRVDSQVDHVASVLGDMSGDLNRMADQTESPLGSLARDGATALRSVSQRLERDGLDGVMGEVRQFARRRPMAFVAGAFAVGLVAGRLVRNTDVGAVANGAQGHASGPHDVGRRDADAAPRPAPAGLGGYDDEDEGGYQRETVSSGSGTHSGGPIGGQR